MDNMDTEYNYGEEQDLQQNNSGFKMSDVPKQAPLVINTPYKPNTLGAHTAP